MPSVNKIRVLTCFITIYYFSFFNSYTPSALDGSSKFSTKSRKVKKKKKSAFFKHKIYISYNYFYTFRCITIAYTDLEKITFTKSVANYHIKPVPVIGNNV